MTTETKVLTAHIPIDLAEKVDRMAERLERSRGWIVKQALVAWLADEEERDRLTREALDDVTEGRLIDDRTVQARAATLRSSKPRRPPG
jgi:predicted transcriptional regulator